MEGKYLHYLQETDYKIWGVNKAKILIHYYKAFWKEIGTFKIKNMKRFWKIVSD